MTSPITFTGPVTVNLTIDVPSLAAAVAQAVTDRIDQMEHTMTQAFTTVEEALNADELAVDNLIAAEQADRAAFDALSTVVLTFIANLPAPGETLTPEHAAQAQAIVDKLTAAQATQSQEAADEAALQADVPPTA